MSTRSTISVVQKDNSVKSVYCHFDGYISNGVGEWLKSYFNSYKSANKVISEGDLSSVYGENFESYYSKRGEDINIEYFSNLESFLRNKYKQEFNYLFINGKWQVALMDNDYKVY
tara:strand:+ start:3712 stop:4056 length:345 start_codon:yes stop_codon:yes gene_type:complete